MISNEDIGNALEKQALEKAMNSPYNALSSEEVLNEVQLNQKIMTPEWRSDKLTIMKPKIKIETCWVPKLDGDGNEVFYKGELVVKRKQVKVFDGWKTDEIDIPGGNIFTSDFNTAILGDNLINLVNRMTNTRQTIAELSIATGDDYSYDLYKYTCILGTILNVSKSRYGKTLEMLKTNITRGEMTNTIKQMLLQDKKKGLFAGFRKRLPF